MNTFLFLNVFILLLVINKRNTHYVLHVVDVITNIIILYDIYTVIINEYLLEEQIYLCIISYIESNIFTVTDITEFNMRLSTCTSNTHSCTNYVCMYTRKIWKLHILCQLEYTICTGVTFCNMYSILYGMIRGSALSTGLHF